MELALSIYHAFDTKYDDVIKLLPEIKDQGYTHIQLSPSQKSRISIPNSEKNMKDHPGEKAWWFRYQPIEFKVGNYYGTKEQLIELTNKAHILGLKIISDVCLNFMAELFSSKEWLNAEKNDKKKLDEYYEVLDKAYPPFNFNDFTERAYFDQRTKRYNKVWFMGQLPCLRTDTPKVQKVHWNYLQELMDCGVDGFRYDCALWIAPHVMKKYIQQPKKD